MFQPTLDQRLHLMVSKQSNRTIGAAFHGPHERLGHASLTVRHNLSFYSGSNAQFSPCLTILLKVKMKYLHISVRASL
jgi:hypothetical protein